MGFIDDVADEMRAWDRVLIALEELYIVYYVIGADVAHNQREIKRALDVLMEAYNACAESHSVCSE